MDIIVTVGTYILIAFAAIQDIVVLVGIRKRKKAGILEARQPIVISVSFTVFCLIFHTIGCVAYYSPDGWRKKILSDSLIYSFICVVFIFTDMRRVTIDGNILGVKKFFRVKYYSFQDILYEKSAIYYNGKKIFYFRPYYWHLSDAFELRLKECERARISNMKM